MSGNGWIGVDLDGTLAEYNGWVGPTEIGAPIPLMVNRVQDWLAEGQEVRIFTARAFPLGLVAKHEVLVPQGFVTECGLLTHNVLTAYAAVDAIRKWCKQHIGEILPVTCIKDFAMYQLWDDRAVQVEPNTGRIYVPPPKGEQTP